MLSALMWRSFGANSLLQNGSASRLPAINPHYVGKNDRSFPIRQTIGACRFVWPRAENGTVSLTRAQVSMLLEGIDWRRPARTWKPDMAF